MARHSLVTNMSRKGSSRDNAVTERFFLSFKMERIWQFDYANHEEAITDIAEYSNLPPIAFKQ
jgi:putative transposase